MRKEPHSSDHLDANRYAVWSEGYIANGERDRAKSHGVVTAESFEEACDIIFTPLTIKHPGYYKKDPLCWWGCLLFDNEVDARRKFG